MTEKKKIQEIEDLPGVGPASAEKLKEASFNNLMSIAVATPGELIEAAGVTESAARKLINTARNEMDMGFASGEELLEKRAQVIKLKTGSTNFDTMMGGGFETGCITECFGEFGSSKTQVANVLAVNVQLPFDQGGAEGAGLDPLTALRNIKVARAFNSDHQMLLAEKVEDLIVNEKLPIKLVIVDSLTSHFRAEFVGRGTLSDRQQKLNKHMHVLAKLASTYNLCVYVTNQVMSKPDTFLVIRLQRLVGIL